MKGKDLSLIGAIFCFTSSIILFFGFNALTFNEVSFTDLRPVVDAIIWVGSAMLFAFGLFFLRDYSRS